jgi:hypothetical protein
VSTAKIKPLQIDEQTDSESTLRLFSVMVQAARNSESQFRGKFELLAGSLLIWRKSFNPSLDVLRQAVETGRVPQSLQSYLRPGSGDPRVFLNTLRAALDNGPAFGVTDVPDLVRLLALVAQTQNTTILRLQNRNLDLANRYLPSALGCLQQSSPPQLAAGSASPSPDALRAAISAYGAAARPAPLPAPSPQPPLTPRRVPAKRFEQPYADRIDERGAYVASGPLHVWHASSRGPAYTRKPDNQDAVYATISSGTVIFAIADGVSTSTGARYGAAANAYFFCAMLRDCLKSSPDRGPDLLLKAARNAHSALDSLLETLLAQWTEHDFAEVYADMGRDGAARILENTRSPKRDWPPALASTLIGGYLTPDGTAATGQILRIGDGVVEKLSPSGHCVSVLGMDSAVTEVSSFFGPGPAAAGSLSSARAVPIALDPGEWLLVSSDGLTRGHANSVTHELSTLLGPDFLRILEPREGAALTLLDRAADAADQAHASGVNSALFADNLSLLLVANAGGRPQ